MLNYNITIGGEEFSIPWVQSSPISGSEFYIWYEGFNPQTTHACARDSSQWASTTDDRLYKVMFEIAGVPIYGKSDKYYTPDNSGHRYLYIKDDNEYIQIYDWQSNNLIGMYPDTADFYKVTGIFLYFSHNYENEEIEPEKPRLKDLYISPQFYTEYRIQRSIYDDVTYKTVINPSTIMNYAYMSNSFDAVAHAMGAMYYRVLKGDVSQNLNLGQILIDRGLLNEEDFEVWLDEITTEQNEQDDDFGGSGANYGGGTWDDSSDYIGHPTAPTVSAASSGLLHVYNPSIPQLQEFSDWLWSDNIVDIFIKAINQPLDYIVQLNLVPVVPSNVGSRNLKFLYHDTGLSLPVIANNYQVFSCGSYDLGGRVGSFLDYNAKCQLYVPFCGVQTIDMSLAVNSVIDLSYVIDLLSGDCIATVKFNKTGVDSENLNGVVYHYRGNCAVQVPLNARDFSQAIRTIASGNITSAVTGGLAPEIQTAGNYSNNAGVMDIFEPYLIITWDMQSKPSLYTDREGITSNISVRLSSLNGYAEILEGTYKNNVPCTTEEEEEINSLLQGGVYFE